MPVLFNIDRKTTGSLIVAMLAVCALGTSCSEELGVEHFQQTDQMSFNVSISNNWNIAKTRSAEQSGRTVSSTKIENSDLWLITTVEENPDTTLFERPEAETRATPYDPTDNDGNNDRRLTDFGVYAWTFTGEDWDNAADKSLYIGGDQAINSGGVWSTDPLRFWPGDAYNMKFFAYAPYAEDSDNPRTIGVTDGTPVITYTTNSDARQQQDLLATTKMVAPDDPDGEVEAEVPGNYNQPLPLRFHHILTAVNVKASDPLNRTITGIKFTGVHASGTYTLGATEWQTTDEEAEINCTGLGENGTGVDLTGSTADNPVEVIADADNTTFMMIPQTLGENATIEVTFSNGETLTASLTGKIWGIGQRVTYIISDSGILGEISVTETITFTYETEETVLEDAFTIRSVYTGGSDGNPAPWIATFDIDGDGEYESTDPPYWLKNFPKSGDGGANEEYNITAERQEEVNPHNDWLQDSKRGTKGREGSPYDLSTNGGETIMRTANCYIINAPGVYSFPLVYGNAIDEKIEQQAPYQNTSAYSTEKTGKVLRTFVNHANVEIENPWIASNYEANEALIVPHDAVLVWQDAENLISGIELTDKNGNKVTSASTVSAEDYRIEFNVSQYSITQGNAVIAVRNASEAVLWSWHIWVTDYEPNLEPTVTPNYDRTKQQRDKVIECAETTPHRYIFMGVPLGWCDVNTYERREVKVKFKQTHTKEFCEMTIIQTPSLETGNAPFYQWGRKDPMLPGTGYGTVNKTYYESGGSSSTILQTREWEIVPNLIGNWISYPQIFWINGSDTPPLYNNLWDMNHTDNEDIGAKKNNRPVKTIYDPSPVGYTLPPPGSFHGLTYNGNDVGDYQTLAETALTFYQRKFNSPYSSYDEFRANRGMLFYCYGMKGQEGNYDTDGGVVYFPSLGCRSQLTGEELYVFTQTSDHVGCYYWTTLPVSYMGISERYVQYNKDYWSSGNTVRPISEDEPN